MGGKLIKGAIFNGYLAFIRKKWGKNGEERAMEYVGVRTAPRDGEWISLEKAYGLLDWIEKEHGREYIPEAGRWMMKGMKGDFRFMFASLMSFERALKKVQKEISGLLFKGNGVDIDINGREATIRLKDFRMGELSCLAWSGALKGVMDATKTEGDTEVTDSGNESDCLIKAKWV